MRAPYIPTAHEYLKPPTSTGTVLLRVLSGACYLCAFLCVLSLLGLSPIKPPSLTGAPPTATRIARDMFLFLTGGLLSPLAELLLWQRMVNRRLPRRDATLVEGRVEKARCDHKKKKTYHLLLYGRLGQAAAEGEEVRCLIHSRPAYGSPQKAGEALMATRAQKPLQVAVAPHLPDCAYVLPWRGVTARMYRAVLGASSSASLVLCCMV